MLDSVAAFLEKHHFPLPSQDRSIVDILLKDMNQGLEDPSKSYEDMSLTWTLPPRESPKHKSVIVIDAGGTNFRSCLVNFDGEGNASITDFKKSSMPGVEKELSRTEFFNAIADNIDYLKNKASRIGFCFSYSMTITPEGDGIPNSFSKEIKASEVVGCHVGACLKETLEKRGWNSIEHIALLNDTVAALLAGAAAIPEGVEYSSYVGFILGTGMNGAYIQPEGIFGTRKIEKQIVVCESGKTVGFNRSDFDKTLDEKSQHPGEYQLEKCCSGAYLGPLAFEVLQSAASEGCFCEQTAQAIKKMGALTLIDVDRFLYAPCKSGLICDCITSEKDRSLVYELLDVIIDRSAWYAANILSACVIQSGQGRDACHPVSILINGTTYYKTHHLRQRCEGYLDQLLWKDRGIFYEVISRDNDITIGTAIAGLL